MAWFLDKEPQNVFLYIQWLWDIVSYIFSDPYFTSSIFWSSYLHYRHYLNGIQLYPQKWPKKLHLSVKNQAVKDELLVKGVIIFNKHVDFEDDTGVPVIRVMVYDASLMINNDQIQGVIEAYWKVLNVEDEPEQVRGRLTSWTTGTRIVHVYKCV